MSQMAGMGRRFRASTCGCPALTPIFEWFHTRFKGAQRWATGFRASTTRIQHRAGRCAGAPCSAGPPPGAWPPRPGCRSRLGTRPRRARRGCGTTPSELFAQWRADRGNDRHIPDVSYAGYAAGEVPVPTVRTAVQAREFGAVPDGRDNTEAIQTAIINAALRGGGAVQLEAGDYRCDGVIRLNRSGVVLRGAGQSATRLVFTRSLKQVFGQNLEDGKSQWSWSGGLVWVGPTDTFNPRLQILDWAGRPVDTSGNRTTDWEQWRSGGNGEGKRLARVLDDRIRGSTQVRVDNPAGLKQGSYVLMTWRSRGAEGDFGLMKRLGGDKLMSSRLPLGLRRPDVRARDPALPLARADQEDRRRPGHPRPADADRHHRRRTRH